MKKMWNKIVFQIKRVPWYGWAAGILFLLLDIAFYNLAKPIVNAWSHQWAIAPKIDGIDGAIPFVGYFWIEVYMFAWLFWIFGPIVASVSKKDRFVNYLFSLLVLYFVSFLFFSFMPTHVDRLQEGLILQDGSYGPLINNMHNGLSKLCMKCTIYFDGGRFSPNSIPCLHCSISLMCYLAINRNKDISLGSRIYAIVLAVLIGWSTLFTKQHYFVDAVCGYLMAIICWYVIKLIKPGERLVKKYPNLFIIKKKQDRELHQAKKHK